MTECRGPFLYSYKTLIIYLMSSRCYSNTSGGVVLQIKCPLPLYLASSDGYLPLCGSADTNGLWPAPNDLNPVWGSEFASLA